MALTRARVVALALLALHGTSTLAATLRSNSLSQANTSSSDVVGLSVLNISPNNDEYADCFNPATLPRGLYPAEHEDCLEAVKQLFYVKPPFRSTTFARRPGAGFKLPTVVRNGTCVISIDVMHDTDEDIFKPLLMYATARELALRCTQGAFRYGGRSLTGPKMVVEVLVFGRIRPLENGDSELVASDSAVVVTGEQLTSRDLSLLNESSLELTEPTMAKPASRGEILNLNNPVPFGSLQCYDPPLPRERAWPIDIKDCETATEAIFGEKQVDQKYTFSREPVATKFYYPLPATFRNRSCVVHIDMNNKGDQDTVRLSIVEATAWVLAHKCCGEEQSVEQYGGRGTVGGGSKGLINVWVYGRPWPPPAGASNMTSLVLAQPPPLIESE